MQNSNKTSYVQKSHVWNSSICSCENNEFLGIIRDDSVITCEKNTDSTKNAPINLNKRKATCKIDNFYILTASFLITI